LNLRVHRVRRAGDAQWALAEVWTKKVLEPHPWPTGPDAAGEN
jgi:hypothetical protein